MTNEENLSLLIAPAPPPGTSYIYATVTDDDPLTIALDGDDDDEGNLTPLDMTPLSLVAGLAINNRVLCVRYGQQLIILGKVGGAPPPTDSGWISFTTNPTGTGRYRKVGNRVDFVYSTTSTLGAVSEATVYTLPTGYRPAYRTAYAASAGSTGTRDASGIVETTGEILVRNNAADSSGANLGAQVVHGAGTFYID